MPEGLKNDIIVSNTVLWNGNQLEETQNHLCVCMDHVEMHEHNQKKSYESPTKEKKLTSKLLERSFPTYKI